MKHKIHNLIILDESGSMEAIKKIILEGLTETLLNIKKMEKYFENQDHYISIVSFNGMGRKIHYWQKPISEIEGINDISYKPSLNTPLFDAVGSSMKYLYNELREKVDYSVLVSILTDGVDNSSVEYNKEAIKRMIEEFKVKNWTFTYIGTGHDVNEVAKSISIENVLSFERNDYSIRKLFKDEIMARRRYRNKLYKGDDTRGDFYKND